MEEKTKPIVAEEVRGAKPIEGTIVGSGGYLVQIPVEEEGLEKIPLEKIVDLAEKSVEALKKIRVISLKMTTANDWIDQQGKPYLTEDGAEAIAVTWGVDLFDMAVEKSYSEDEKGKFYIYTAKGKIYSKKLRRYIEEIGTCSQRDQFFGQVKGEFKPVSEIDETTIKKAAATNLKCRGIKACIGLKNVTYEELKAAGIDTSKIVKIKYKEGKERVAKTATEKDKDIQKNIWNMLLQITGGNVELAAERLKMESGFKAKDNKWVEGKTDVKYLTGKWLTTTYYKVKKIYEKQFPQQELPLEDKRKEKEGE